MTVYTSTVINVNEAIPTRRQLQSIFTGQYVCWLLVGLPLTGNFGVEYSAEVAGNSQ